MGWYPNRRVMRENRNLEVPAAKFFKLRQVKELSTKSITAKFCYKCLSLLFNFTITWEVFFCEKLKKDELLRGSTQNT